MAKPDSYDVLSLFAGCGGLDLGFRQAGFRIHTAIDNWQPAVDAHALNKRLLGGKVIRASLALSDDEIRMDDLPKCDVVLGGPPCQGFSFAGRQRIDDPRNNLYLDFLRIVRHTEPLCFVMENVRGMEAMALDDVKGGFSTLGYSVTVDRAIATNFGVPQRRERLLIIGFRKDLEHRFIPPEANIGGLFSQYPAVSLFEAIEDLPPPIEVGKDTALPSSSVGHLTSHVYAPLSDMVQRFLRHVPNGGCYRDAPRRKLPERLKKILDDAVRYRSPRLFPKPDPFEPAQTVPADTNPSIGGVIAPDLTYTRGGKAKVVNAKNYTVNGVYTAPNPSRRITPREAARLQTFPDEFMLTGGIGTQFRLVGNAVPVKMAQAYAEKVREQLDHCVARKPKKRTSKR